MKRPLDIASLSAGYTTGQFSPEDVINDIYNAIDRIGEKPVWISLRSREEALRRLARSSKGPLFGIPFAVKDNIDVAGMATTCACPAFAYNPKDSAFTVEKLEVAGAILIGKTNMDQFATGLVGTRSPYGIPANAFNKDFISGGSSSGSAVAVASGLVSFALGTDTAGSGRVPAAFNNIVGLKPTKGLISASGVVPACKTQDTISIFATTVPDAARVFEIASVFDGSDAFARLPYDRSSGRARHSELRIGVPREPLEFLGDTMARELYEDSVSRAQALGARIVEFEFAPFVEAARLLYQGPWVAERLAAIRDFAGKSPEALHEVVGKIILSADAIKAVDAFSGFYRLASLTREAERQWNKMDMMLLPTAPTIYRIADVLADPVRLNSNLGLYTNFVNLMDLAALAIPAGIRRDALPFGVTLISRTCEDDRLADFGDRLHRSVKAAKLGATGFALEATPALAPKRSATDTVQVAVVGAHLSGQPLHGQLTERNARLVRTARTAPGYRLYELSGTAPRKPGLVFDGQGAGIIEVEIWEMDFAAFGSFVALIPYPLGIGMITLDDGTRVKGFLCEAHAVSGARDITGYGGWRAWLAGEGGVTRL